MGNLRFPKGERLNKKKSIEELFEKGDSFSAFPLKVIFTKPQQDHPSPHQVLISVPSRNFARAVDRNLLKRRIREGYRLHRASLPPSPVFRLAYIYIAREILPSQAIHLAIKSSFKRLINYEKKD